MKRTVPVMIMFFSLFSLRPLEGQVASFAVDTNRIRSYEVVFTALDTSWHYEYAWQFGDGTADTGRVVTHRYAAAGEYRVDLKVWIPNTNRIDTKFRFVTVSDVVQVPNVVAPNNDNVNDLFIIRSNGEDRFTLTVFTPAGVKVCETRGQTIVWDGRTPAGNLVSPGVYYYVLTSDKGIRKAGFVHVLR